MSVYSHTQMQERGNVTRMHECILTYTNAREGQCDTYACARESVNVMVCTHIGVFVVCSGWVVGRDRTGKDRREEDRRREEGLG
mmetsp:Transcript_35851/g.93442  ORF Transcript_35851/g.93442 Transcript_35851/m.93442 type:complete len:84 (-) Transcript_35851:51-302(-)